MQNCLTLLGTCTFFFHFISFLLPVSLSCICAVGIWVAVGILDSQMVSIGLKLCCVLRVCSSVAV